MQDSDRNNLHLIFDLSTIYLPIIITTNINSNYFINIQNIMIMPVGEV